MDKILMQPTQKNSNLKDIEQHKISDLKQSLLISLLKYYKNSLEIDSIHRFELQESCKIIISDPNKNHSIFESKEPYFYAEIENEYAMNAIFEYCTNKNSEYIQKFKSKGQKERFEFYFADFEMKKSWAKTKEDEQIYKDNPNPWVVPFYIDIGISKDQQEDEANKTEFQKKCPRQFCAEKFFKDFKENGIDNIQLNKTPIEIYLKVFLESINMALDKGSFLKKCDDICNKKYDFSIYRIDSYKNYINGLKIMFLELFSEDKLDTDDLKSLWKLFYSKLYFGITGTQYRFDKNEQDISYKKILIVVDTTKQEPNEMMNRGLISLYDCIIDNPPHKTNLLNKIFKYYSLFQKDDDFEDSCKLDMSMEKNIEFSKKQLGTFDFKYPLTNSQRYCLHMTKSGLDIIPISGPPGTGKTSLLKSFMADYMVDCALDLGREIKADRENIDLKRMRFFPPLVVYSTNNQALNNVAESINESFEKLSLGSSKQGRWIKIKNEVFDKLFAVLVKARQGDPFKSLSDLISIKNQIREDIDEQLVDFVQCCRENYPLLLSDFDGLSDEEIKDRALILKTFINGLYKKLQTNKKLIESSFDSIKLDKYYAFQRNKTKLQKTADLFKKDEKFSQQVGLFQSKEEMQELIEETSERSSFALKELSVYENQSNEIFSLIDYFDKKDKAIRNEQKIIRKKIKKNTYKRIFIWILNCFGLKISVQEPIIDNTSSQLEENNALKKKKIKAFNLEMQNLKKRLKKRLQTKFISSVQDAKKLILLADFENDTTSSEEMMAILEEINQKADEIRFEQFIDSRHFLEACLLLKIKHESQISLDKIPCPKCGKNKLIHKEEHKNLFCGCGFRLLNFDGLPERELLNFLLDGCIVQKKESKDENSRTLYHFSVDASKWNLDTLADIFCLFPLLGTTSQSFYGTFKTKDIDGRLYIPESYFKYVIVDEAGMVLPSYLINAFASQKIVLLGDTKQIPSIPPYSSNAIVDNNLISLGAQESIFIRKSIFNCFDATDDPLSQMINKKFDLDPQNYPFKAIDIFENYSLLRENAMSVTNRAIQVRDDNRQRASQEAPFWLLEHFRCAEPIIEFCNDLMYQGKMRPMKKYSDEDLKIYRKIQRSLINFESSEVKHLYFISHHFSSDYKKSNKEEIELVIKIIEKIKSIGIQAFDIGVITPHSDQEIAIKRKIDRQCVAGTVHKFQGSERKVIIFSTATRSGSSGNLFMNTKGQNILNVALSRAKDLFILVGNEEAMRANKESDSAKLVEYIKKYGIYCSVEELEVN